MSNATWRERISDSLDYVGESWADVVACTLSDEELDTVFDYGYGSVDGAPFTLWTKNRVYFPACYDGYEWVASVSRNPDGLPTEHIGM